MFDPMTLGLGLAVWLAFRKQSSTRFGELTPEREEVYNNAMENLRDPQALMKLATEFKKEGLRAQAYCMEKRAKWRGRPPEVVKQHQEYFNRAMKSQNVEAILEVASAFESMTATIKAGQLRERARSLQELAQQKAASSEKTPEPEQSSSVTNGAAKHFPEEHGELSTSSAEA